MNNLFKDYPDCKLLQKLANGSLDQSQNLIRAIRLWALLRWLYGDMGYSIIASSFSYVDWRKAFFSDTHKDEKQADIINHQDANCACNKTIRQWSSDLNVPVEEWQHSLQAEIPVASSEIEKLLEERLFAQVRKSLQSDFELLVDRKYLQRVNSTGGRSKYYQRVEQLPNLGKIANISTKVNLTSKKQAYLADTLGLFSFLDPNLPVLAEEFSTTEIDEDNHRIFIYVDYVVPESSPTQDTVDEIQNQLQEIWDSKEIPPLLLTYYSAHKNQIIECVIYPVCIYFMEYAKYLCAYGKTPKGDINWYKFRLDRIISQDIEVLSWQDIRVPQLLKEIHDNNQLPTPKTVNQKLKEAWGCDFYKEKALMMLRFDKDFHESYIDSINIHDTFTQITYEQTLKIVQQNTIDKRLQQQMLDILHSRSSTDAYYQVNYRVTDYSVIRWLRALGAKVEVLFPWDLRQEMTREIYNLYNLYQLS